MWWQEICLLLLQYAHECATTYFVHGNVPPWHLHCYCVAEAGRTTNMRSGVGSSVRACLPLARDRFIGASPTQRFALFPGRTGPGNRMRGPGVGSSVRELRCVTTDIHGYMEMTKFLDKYVNQITPKNHPNYMRVIVELNSCLSIRKSWICDFNCQWWKHDRKWRTTPSTNWRDATHTRLDRRRQNRNRRRRSSSWTCFTPTKRIF